ncbi:chromate efflux transporter [soil metagenome]
MPKPIAPVPINIPFPDAVKVWAKVAMYSFGGPAGQIAVMHKLLVEEKKWVSEGDFLHALNYCMLLPGPEAQQLATYIGWLLHGFRGGLVAGGLFILPGFLSILVLSVVYVVYNDTLLIEGLFYGIKPAILAIVVGAVIKIGQRALKTNAMYLIAILAFVGIFFFNVPFPFIVLTAGLIGFVGGRINEQQFYVVKGHTEVGDTSRPNKKPSFWGTVGMAAFWGALWIIPILLLILFLGVENIFVEEALFFSKTAVVTFGGAYAVLAYISQKAVETYGWLRPGEMLDGLGMAETTPGPLIQVVQFVGFMGAYRFPGTLDPLVAGIIGSVVVTWVTFIPCFLFIFTGAPYIEYFRGNKSMSTALSGITAAVVGVILNLAIWFSLHTLFGSHYDYSHGPVSLSVPVFSSIDWYATGIAVLAFVVYFGFKLDMLKTIGICVVAGLVVKWLV